MSMLLEPLIPGFVSPIGGLGTTQKIFQSSVKNPVTGAIQPFYGTVTDYLLPIPAQNKLNATKLKIVASGQVYLHGTTPTFQLQLLGALGSTPQTNVILAQTAAVTLTTNANYDWSFEAELLCSTAPAVVGTQGGGGQVVGDFESLINTTYVTNATLTNPLTGVNMNLTTGPAYFLKMAGLFSVSDALDLAWLTEFYAYTES